MNPWIFLLIVIVAIALALWIPRFRLRQVMKQPFPDEWVEIVERNIGIYKNLPMPLRLQLRQKIKLFLHLSLIHI